MSHDGRLISENLQDAINAQAGREFGASMEYIHIASYFDGRSLPELAAFFFRQSEEEREHGMKFVHFVLEAGGDVKVPEIPAARHGFDSAEDAVQAALGWEVAVTNYINDLVALAIEERNFIAQQFLQWFVTEQLEEVSTMSELLDTVRHAGESNLLLVEDYVVRLGAKVEAHEAGMGG